MLHSTQLHTWLKPLGIALACFFLNTSNAQEAPPDDAEPSTASVLDAFPAPSLATRVMSFICPLAIMKTISK
ncbi:hypothetical protein ACFOEM_10025 [Paenalcaligenes hominis]|uniref:hypothetical protein n=1 Tax=Paenalcaligenes hominis TaxID=643674 RepID=UPI003606C8F8